MKTTFYLAALSIFAPAIAQSQNYQTVQSNKTPFFITTNGDYFLANRIDHIDVQGQDSIFYPFQSIRENEQLNDTDPCKFYVGPSWMGEKIEIKPNGDNVFYNSNNESITIQTTAALNDTFNVYNYPNGDWIDGVVSYTGAISVFGFPDSIKVIDLFSNATLNLSNPRFVLSKNFGFIELFSPYSFPDPYMGSSAVNNVSDYPFEHTSNFSLVGEGSNGFSKPTIGEINDFEIGDIHQFSTIEEEFSVSKKIQFLEREIFNKFVWGQDSVVYFLKNNGFTKTIDVVAGTTQETYLSGEMESVTIYHVNQWENAFLPEEFDGVNGWNSLFINDCGDLEEKVRTEAIEISTNGSCIELTSGNFSFFSSIENVGNLNATGSDTENTFQSSSQLIYYSRSNNNYCGTAEVLSTTKVDPYEFSVYPNPSSTTITITGLQTNQNSKISIYDNLGRAVYQHHPYVQGKSIDVSQLTPGIYQLVLNDGSRIDQTSIVIQN